jgi:hypothetical protein
VNALCFFIGAKTGQAVSKGKGIEVPTIKSPMEIVREHQSTKEAKKEQERLDILLQNIEAYDGTANHQQDVPR